MPPVPQQPILLVGSEEMKGTRVTLSASERDAIVRPLDGTPTEELAFHAVTDPWTVNIKGTDLFQLSGISAVFLNRPTKTSVVLSFTLVVTAWQGKGAGDGATLWVIPTDAGYNPLSDRVQTSVLLLNPAPRQSLPSWN
jgi:hypothetical protein